MFHTAAKGFAKKRRIDTFGKKRFPADNPRLVRIKEEEVGGIAGFKIIAGQIEDTGGRGAPEAVHGGFVKDALPDEPPGERRGKIKAGKAKRGGVKRLLLLVTGMGGVIGGENVYRREGPRGPPGYAEGG